MKIKVDQVKLSTSFEMFLLSMNLLTTLHNQKLLGLFIRLVSLTFFNKFNIYCKHNSISIWLILKNTYLYSDQNAIFMQFSTIFKLISQFYNYSVQLQLNKRMSNKYYHNDYKKMMGVDETRTASEKLLDKAIGGFKKKVEVVDKPAEKKVKEENLNLTHVDVLNKLIKNIEGNKNAVKLLKPLNILKKCMNDQAFTTSPQINKFQQWNNLSILLMDSDDKLVGNYSQNGLVIECLVDIFGQLLILLKKIKGQKEQLKEQHQQEVKEEENGEVKRKQDLDEVIQTCQVHLIYLKLYTDDSFAFNKLLLQFKNKFYSYFQAKLSGEPILKTNLYAYLERLLMKMFNLPFTKYEWVKQSLTQFFKEFNISYKHTLNETHMTTYLRIYNEFINQKIGKGQGESTNIFGTGGKGGKVATIEIASVDGLDKWTSKQ